MMGATISRPNPVPTCERCDQPAVGAWYPHRSDDAGPRCPAHMSVDLDGAEAYWCPYAPVEPAVAPPGLHPAILEGLLHRLGNDLVDAHGDELAAAVHTVAERAACDAYKLGVLHRKSDPAEEAERAKVLQEARNAGHDAGYDAGYDASFVSGREQGQRDERARIAELVRVAAYEEALIKQDHEARAADLDRQANDERDKAERHDERRGALCQLHDLIAKEAP